MSTLSLQIGDISQVKADVVVVNLFEGVTQPGGGTGAVDSALGGVISQELQSGTRGFKGKLGETLIFPTYGKIPAPYVLLVGLGKQDKADNTNFRRAAASAMRASKTLKAKTVATLLHGAGIGNVDPQKAARLLAEGTILGQYEFTMRKTGKDAAGKSKDEPLSHTIDTVIVMESDASKQAAIEQGLKQGESIARATCKARDLVFDTPNYITPTQLAAEAKQMATGSVTAKILDKAAIEKLGMGSFLSVAKGSVEPPQFIHLSYKPSGTAKKKVALVGKGITFDSGGLSLKPPASMELMKDDMAGAAAVICTMKAIGELGDLDIQVDAFVPTCENMPNGNANRPGDIVIAMSGQTIEINNTDAEGRLILCDALTYAQREVNSDELIDLATLTGAQIIALGKTASALMGTDDDLINALKAAGDVAGEKYWQLPLYDEYQDFLKSDVADLKNAGNKGEAGSQAGGMFLKAFIEDGQKWVHVDIAGPSYVDKDLPEVPKGATGVGVRTLLYYLYGWDN